MVWVYVIQNADDRFYIGMTTDLEQRIEDHNSGVSKWTSGRGPWRLVWSHRSEFNADFSRSKLCTLYDNPRGAPRCADDEDEPRKEQIEMKTSIEGIPAEEIEGWKKEAEKRLADQLARAKLQHQAVDSVQRTTLHPHDEIIRIARELSADLLVLSTHGYTGWKRFLFGSDAEKILEHACCPTLVVRSDPLPAGDHSTSRTLLFPREAK